MIQYTVDFPGGVHFWSGASQLMASSLGPSGVFAAQLTYYGLQLREGLVCVSRDVRQAVACPC
jgi:hypothetical protein